WRGVMVEPVPHIFERLQENCGKAPRWQLENVAIAEQDGDLPFYHVAPASDAKDLPGWYEGLGSFRRDIVLKHADAIPDIEKRIVTTKVRCLTFESLCCKNGVGEVDLIHIDAEGFDDRIIRQIDFDSHRPRLLIYEHFHLEPAA